MRWPVWICALLLTVGAQATEAPPVEFVLPDSAWHPGDRWTSGSDWMALVCAGLACRFEPAGLAVQQHEGPQGQPGQQLDFSRTVEAKPDEYVIAWFKTNARLPWLKPRPVPTYAAFSAPTQRPASAGTLEVAVPLPNGRQAALVPLYDKEQQRFMLQLRAPGRRQMLDEIGPCSRSVPADYLLWAGDLDGDGKADYLISFIDGDGEARLYLASEAEGEEIVGVAGSYLAPPSQEGCQDEGWMEKP